MIRTRRVFVLLWCFYLSACGALIPKAFHPTTPDEEAIVRTVQTFLEGIRTNNLTVIQSASLPEATLEMIISGHSVGRQSLSQGIPGEIIRPVQQVASLSLADFRRLSDTHASVASYLQIDTADTKERFHFHWDVTRRGDRWLILNLRVSLSTEPYYIRGGGP